MCNAFFRMPLGPLAEPNVLSNFGYSEVLFKMTLRDIRASNIGSSCVAS